MPIVVKKFYKINFCPSLKPIGHITEFYNER